MKGCLGCNACRYGKPCIQKDAFNGLVPKIKAADCVGSRCKRDKGRNKQEKRRAKEAKSKRSEE